MANICETIYILKGEKSIISDFAGTVDAVAAKNRGHVFLGDLAEAFGIDAEHECIDTRGEFGDYDISLDGTEMTFYIYSKWADLRELFDMIKEKLGEVSLSYIAVETGCELFDKHDEDDDFIDCEVYVSAGGPTFDDNEEQATSVVMAVDDWFGIMGIERPKDMDYSELVDFINDYEDYDDECDFYNIYYFENV